MAAPDELEGQGHAYDDAATKRKDDYRLVIDDSQSNSDTSGKSFGLAPTTAGTGQTIEQALTHPAVPVLCYCVASIIMTIVNKVRALFSVASAELSAHSSSSRGIILR